MGLRRAGAFGRTATGKVLDGSARRFAGYFSLRTPLKAPPVCLTSVNRPVDEFRFVHVPVLEFFDWLLPATAPMRLPRPVLRAMTPPMVIKNAMSPLPTKAFSPTVWLVGGRHWHPPRSAPCQTGR